jgi:hypothetical protein
MRHRKDKNTDEICDVLSRCGVKYRRIGHVLDFCDLLVKTRRGILAVEIKSENDSVLTMAEQKFLDDFKGSATVVYSADEIISKL